MIRDRFWKKHYFQILIGMINKNKSARDISRETGMNENHLRSVLLWCQQVGYVERITKGSFYVFKLTEYGIRVAKKAAELISMTNEELEVKK